MGKMPAIRDVFMMCMTAGKSVDEMAWRRWKAIGSRLNHLASIHKWSGRVKSPLFQQCFTQNRFYQRSFTEINRKISALQKTRVASSSLIQFQFYSHLCQCSHINNGGAVCCLHLIVTCISICDHNMIGFWRVDLWFHGCLLYLKYLWNCNCKKGSL